MPTLYAGRSVGLTRKEEEEEEEEEDKIWFRDLYRTEEGNSTYSLEIISRQKSVY